MNYLPNSPEIRRQMLAEIGVSDFEKLIETIPASLRLERPLNLPPPLSELELDIEVNRLAEKNAHIVSNFAGAGSYDHFIPAAIEQIVMRSEYYTAYTPYQAEVAQGTLQTIYEFQTFISRLTGLPVTNASMYDGATALAEAVRVAIRQTGRDQVLISQTVNPNYLDTVKTYLSGWGNRVRTVGSFEGTTDYDDFKSQLSERTAAVVIQSPNFFGLIEKTPEFASDISEAGALFIVVYDPLSLGILSPPGECGAHLAVAEGQPLGLPLSFGGPYLGLLSARREFLRQMPGRLSGRTTDARGRTGFVLTLQTREQHIRRQKATSNICTNQALCALAATIYLSLLGREGLEQVGRLCLSNSHYAAAQIARLPGFSLKFPGPFFKEFVVETPIPPKKVISRLAKKGIVPGVDMGQFKLGLKGCLMIAVTEKRRKKEIDQLVFELSQAA